MNGLELQRHLRNRHVRVPTIMVTADDAPEARARCLAAGASAFLRKPIGADELLAALDHAVHRA
jgi:two-component system, LuxR family, response regulator FixJ